MIAHLDTGVTFASFHELGKTLFEIHRFIILTSGSVTTGAATRNRRARLIRSGGFWGCLSTEECDISGRSKVIAMEFHPRTNSLRAVSCKSTSFDD